MLWGARGGLMLRAAMIAFTWVALLGCQPTSSMLPATDPPPGAGDAADLASAATQSDGGTDSSMDLGGGVKGGGPDLTPNQKAVAEAMTSIWENDTPIL